MASLVALAWMGALSPAFAADVDPFQTASSTPFQVGSPQGESAVLGKSGISAGLYTSTARNLAVYRFSDGTEEPLVSDVFRLEAHGGYTWKDKVRFDLFVPFYPFAEATDTEFSGPAMGDIRVQATVPLYGEMGDVVAIAVVPKLGIPSGSGKAYLTQGINGGVTAAVSGEVWRIDWVANVGMTLAPASAIGDVTLGSTFDALGAAAFRIDDHFRAGAEINLGVGIPKKKTGHGNSFLTGMLFTQLSSDSGFGLMAGAGGGLVAGVGSPDFRLYAGLTYGIAVRDGDSDGIPDKVDGCPLDAEDKDQFEDSDGCPEADNDSDGVPDLGDRCPLEPEDVDGFIDDDGCPEPDNDADSIVDTADDCPLTAGVAALKGCPDADGDSIQDEKDSCPTEAGPPETQGCPDQDNDRVPDSRDKCPLWAMPADENPLTSDGCPKRVYLSSEQIKITEKVFFETGNATIKSESFGLLDDVASVLLANPNIILVEIGGHTDDVGDDAKNLKLSQSRAEAVSEYLVKKGVDKGRLTAKGYGETASIDTNRTEIGRGVNRRVEFKILTQAKPK